MDEERVRKIAREEAKIVLEDILDKSFANFVEAGKEYSNALKASNEIFTQLKETTLNLTISVKTLGESLEDLKREIRPVIDAFNEEQNTKRLLSKKFGAWGDIFAWIGKVTASLAGVVSFIWLVFKYMVNQAL